MNKTQLYNPKILNIYKNLQYYKTNLDKNKIYKCNEIRSCGLKICLEVEIVNDIVTSIYYNGTGDCISITSTEILCKICRNKSIVENNKIVTDFLNSIHNNDNTIFENELQYLKEISIYPLKVKNIIMSWSILRNILLEAASKP